ncbi:TetR/AcrR family transcriptional regulator [Paenarthrobacter aromaticivorans]|uniref:TetR/AcrR family transcriptional regulator n=1 Tax=Paenarthrobacter aromaticivorans TaxID=2849150 RepID=A0ABS6I7W2_9MICC|nr:TetR/AcrR family transcriptional regulator [Paenarthrobacter sp. MMS21-TAE1-1]MBU8867811.1 TetR/AcrR family transcriptional regulator [Paenarthrobacter sp. MMS21-TAE1-1]
MTLPLTSQQEASNDPELSEIIAALDRASAGSSGERGDTRERLLAAAMPAFATEGFRATTIRSLASAVGITPGAVYAHFDSKEAILSAALARTYRKFLIDVVIPQDGEGAGVRFDGLCRRHMLFQMENSEIASASDMLLLNEMVLQAADPATVQVIRRAKAAYFDRIYQEVIRLDAGPGGLRLKVKTRAVLVVCDSLSAEPRPETEGMDRKAVLDQYMRLVSSIIRP